MDSGMFYEFKKTIAAFKLQEVMVLKEHAYKKTKSTDRKVSRKRRIKLRSIQREGVGLFVWSKVACWVTSAEAFIDAILYDKHILSHQEQFWKQWKGIFGFTIL
jgi:hypothetical protein